MNDSTVDSNPLVLVLSIGEHHSQSKVARSQGGCCMFHQIILMSTLRNVLLGLERLRRTAPTVKELKNYITQ